MKPYGTTRLPSAENVEAEPVFFRRILRGTVKFYAYTPRGYMKISENYTLDGVLVYGNLHDIILLMPPCVINPFL